MPLETSAEAPVPVRTVMRLVGDWIGRLGRVWVEGQIAELNRRGSTVFLTLRDPLAAVSVRVICPRTVLEATQPAPEEGARVVIWAKPEFNAAKGTFALAATEMRAVGIGELLARLERLKKSLAAEGLFSASRKRPLPFLPATVGLICGRESAAERDVLRNAARRWPAVQFRVEEVAVQGTNAAGDVIRALQRLDADPAVEVIIIARGGGSIEDLLPFSDEDLIRAAAATVTPVISAIGHEQDVPLLDLVADVRASTPTDAARRAVPDVVEQLALIDQLRSRARRSLAGRLERELSWVGGGPFPAGAGQPDARDRPPRGTDHGADRAGPAVAIRRAWPGPATTSRTPGLAWWRCPRRRRCAAATRSSSARTPGWYGRRAS